MTPDPRHIYRKRDRLRQFRAFCQVARLGSITAAAEHLRMETPGVSVQVRELEHELDTQLFERNGPRLTLTAAGEEFHRLVGPLVESMDALPETFARQITRIATEEIRMAVSLAGASSVLPALLRQFRDEHPRVRLHVATGGLEQTLRLLHAGEVELVFGMEGPGGGVSRTGGSSSPSSC